MPVAKRWAQKGPDSHSSNVTALAESWYLPQEHELEVPGDFLTGQAGVGDSPPGPQRQVHPTLATQVSNPQGKKVSEVRQRLMLTNNQSFKSNSVS